MLSYRAAPILAVFCGMLNAQTPAKVDFRRDVQPILKSNCYGCHGPAQQMNNYRLDRRRDALRGGTIAVIAPGSSQSSHLYLRLIRPGPHRRADASHRTPAQGTGGDHQTMDRPGCGMAR